MSHNPILRKGDVVKVVDVDPNGDDPTNYDNYGNEIPANCELFRGCVGVITEVSTGGRASVGQRPRDPFYTVRVPGLGTDGFWGEELEKLASKTR